MKNFKLFLILFLSPLLLWGQYTETFSIPNKGILSGPCTTNDYTTCVSHDFAGVNWTIEGDLSGIDAEPFATAGGVLTVDDIDGEACWVSPVLEINIGGPVSFNVDLTWLGYDEDTGDGSDYIDLEYKVDGGSWVQVPNLIGGGGHTIEYLSGGGTNNPAPPNNNLGTTGITGNTLQIRVCIDHNSGTSETTTIDNVNVPETGVIVQGSGPTCDIAITSIVVGGQDCPANDDGSITVTATTSNGPILYQITGPVNQSNATGVFTNLPAGNYTIIVDDGSFLGGTCTDSDTRTISVGVDNTTPTASNPTTTNVVCLADVPAVDPEVVTDENDSCTIPCTQDPWINEFHYDNVGGDVGEFIEVAGPAGIDLSGYTIYTYDGSDRMVDQIVPLSGIIDNEQNGFGAVTKLISNLQNTMEGIALVRNPNTVVEFLSYEGSFLALDGPALGMTSVDVGIAEPTSQPVNESLSRIGTGNIGTEFTFADQVATSGSLNTNQTIVPCPENAPVVAFVNESNNSGAGSQASPLVITRTYRVTDGAGNFINVFHTINVIDDEDPAITCPTGPIVANNNAGLCSAVVNYSTPSFTDNCSGGAISLTAGLGNGAAFPVGNTTETYIATDAAGNTASCSFVVTVVDIETPSAVCQDITVDIQANEQYTLTAAEIDGGSTDNCVVNLSIDPTVFDCDDVGNTIAVTLNVSDDSGNAVTCTANVTVADANSYCNQPPTAVCQNITVFTDANCQGTAVATDFDGGSSDPESDPITFSVNPTGPYSLGTTNVVLTVSDAQGSNNCNATITVEDNQPPVAGCQDITVQLDAAGNATINGNAVNNNSTDNCGIVNYQTSPNSFSCSDVGTHAVQMDVFDQAGLSDNCTANVTVQDGMAPNALCQDITVQLDANGAASLVAADIDGGSTDNCGIASLAADITTFDCAQEGAGNAVTVTLMVTDVNGNAATCTAQVEVDDNILPVAGCQDITVQLDAGGNASISEDDVESGSTDNCGFTNALNVTPSSFDCSDVGPNTVTVTVGDGNGNQNTCTATVTVEDKLPPVITCQDVTIQLDATGNKVFDIFIDGPALVSQSDNCALQGGAFRTGPGNFTCAQVGDFPITIFKNDVNGNQTTCNITLTIEDNVAPNAICQDFTVQLDANGNASVTGNDIDGGSTDACGIASLSANPNTFDCTDVGANTSTLTVTDNNGNSNTCTANVTVEDNQPPIAVCQDITLNLTSAGTTSLAAAMIDGGSSTACGTFSLSVAPNGFTCDDLGTQTVTLTVTDDSNNQTDNCTATVTVADPNSFCCDPPAAVCNDLTVQLDANGNASVTAAQVGAGSTADCGLLSETVTLEVFNCGDVGTNTVTYTITDIKNQSDNCTATIIVEDNVAPTALCQDVTVQLDASGNGSTTAEAVDNGSNDACGVAAITLTTPGLFTCDEKGTNTVTLTVTDLNGNSSNCTATATVEDNILPTALCQDITVQLDASGNATIIPDDVDGGSSDNCTFFLLSLDNNAFGCSNVGSNTVQLTVSDFSGNNASCNANVMVEDNVAPTALCQDVTVQLDDNGDGATTAGAVDNGSNDACGIASTSLAPTAFTCANIGPNTVTLTVTDNNGNVSSCPATVTVEDNVAPTITECEGQFVIFNGEDEMDVVPAIDFSATDACGLAGTTYSPAVITCDQLGTEVEVAVTVMDVNGNPSTCITTVKVDGLPCGFMDFGDDGIGCEDSNEASYDGPSETFTLESDGCYTTNFNQDNAAYIKAELCGDGEIIAHVASINPLGQGWAGISMRESEAPGSKKVELMVNLSNFVRRAVRTVTNGVAYPAQFFRPQATWLRIVRTGNQFIGYASTNGSSWQAVMAAYVPMNTCIQAGLVVTNYNAGNVIATFDNVEVNEYNNANLQIPDTDNPEQGITQNLDFSIFPNPVKEKVHLDLVNYYGQEAKVEMLNQLGQPVLQRQVNEIGSSPETFDLNGLSSGTYFIRVTTDKGDKVKRFLIVK